MNGTIITIAAGGAFRDSRDNRLIKDATRLAGRCLSQKPQFFIFMLKIGSGEHVRRAEEHFRHSEESCTVLEMKNIPV